MPTKQMPQSGLGLMSAPADSQAPRTELTVVINDGPYHSEVMASRPRFLERGEMFDVVRWFPRRGFAVTETYRRFRPPVLPLRLPRGTGPETLRRRGFHPLTVYLKEGGYFRRTWAQGHWRGNPALRPVVVWHRGGEFFRPVTDHPRGDLPLGH